MITYDGFTTEELNDKIADLSIDIVQIKEQLSWANEYGNKDKSWKIKATKALRMKTIEKEAAIAERAKIKKLNASNKTKEKMDEKAQKIQRHIENEKTNRRREKYFIGAAQVILDKETFDIIMNKAEERLKSRLGNSEE